MAGGSWGHAVSAVRVDVPRLDVARAAQDYVAAGWALVPIPLGTKGPQDKGWSSRTNCVSTPEQARRMHGNVGLAHAYSGTCVLDLDDVAQARIWLRGRGVNLDELWSAPETVRIHSGKLNRGKLLYRLPPGVAPLITKKVANGAIELRCGNAAGTTVQDVLPPSVHPDTGQPYVWEYGDDLLADWRCPPVLPDLLLALWREMERGPAYGSDGAAWDDDDPLMTYEPRLGVDSAELRDWLEALDPDMGYDDWLHVGMALHHECEGSADGLELWVEWSTKGTKFKGEDDLARRWDGFRAKRRCVTARWIRRRAGVATAKSKGVLVLDAKNPMNCAKSILGSEFESEQGRTLVSNGGIWFEHNGKHYRQKGDDEMHSFVWCYLDKTKKHGKDGAVLDFNPQPSSVHAVLDAMRAQTYVDSASPPLWLPGYGGTAPADTVVLDNGLFYIPERTLLPHTPGFFSMNALPFAWVTEAKATNWLAFLDSVFPDDQESKDALQEMFGYLLTSDTSQHKMFLVVGPKRCGKGTIGRVLTALLGPENVASPQLSQMTSNFGLQPLIGKLLALVSDARIGSRTDTQAIVERLLMVSGEDSVTIDRKHLTAWTGKLPTRFLLMSNETPQLGDSSGALAGRFVVIEMKQSFYGREDTGLTNRLLAELPGVFRWALEGRERLNRRGFFVQPSSSQDAIDELEEINSPISTFIKECCVCDSEILCDSREMFAVWQAWCREQGRVGTNNQTFGKALRSVVHTVKISRPRVNGEQLRFYTGIGLSENAKRYLL